MWEERRLGGERNVGVTEMFVVLLDRYLGWGNLCYVELPMALPETCSLIVTTAPSYWDFRKFPSLVLKCHPGWGQGPQRDCRLVRILDKVCLALT